LCGRFGAKPIATPAFAEEEKQGREFFWGSDGEGQVGMKKLELNDEGENSWLDRDDEDLISKVVSDFRDQRLSMVQSLRQFVLCYETVLEWFARQSPLDSGKRKA